MSEVKRGEFNIESIAFINQHQESVDLQDVCVVLNYMKVYLISSALQRWVY